MKIKRRTFLKSMAGTLALTASRSPAQAANINPPISSNALGFLYDSTRCIGCKACMGACKKANKMPVEHIGKDRLWDNPNDLSAKTLTIIKRYHHGNAQNKNQVENGYAFIRRQCMHCVQPACVLACPVSALTKDPVTGLVGYDRNACIGCRCCQIACPYNIPKFEWDSPFPEIVKCQLCHHLLPKNKIAACCEACPNGASVFGLVKDLIPEAKHRLTLKPGTYYDYPISTITSKRKLKQKVSRYLPHIYGEMEGGGTQILMLASIPFNKLGLPALPNEPHTLLPNRINKALYQYLAIPLLAFGGLAFLINRGQKNQE